MARLPVRCGYQMEVAFWNSFRPQFCCDETIYFGSSRPLLGRAPILLCRRLRTLVPYLCVRSMCKHKFATSQVSSEPGLNLSSVCGSATASNRKSFASCNGVDSRLEHLESGFLARNTEVFVY